MSRTTHEPAEAPIVPLAAAEAPKANDNVLISAEGLQQLLAGVVAATGAAQQSQSSTDMKSLVEALLETRKPYVDPKQEDNLRRIREQDQITRERQIANVKAEQGSCPHMQGSNALSEFSGQLTAIVQHKTDIGEVVGICTNCIRVFRTSDPDYRVWMAKKSGNRISKSGDRYFAFQPVIS